MVKSSFLVHVQSIFNDIHFLKFFNAELPVNKKWLAFAISVTLHTVFEI